MREMTGRHVLAIFALGFGTIIAVNVTLAVQAVGTFPGLETKNSYVASQKFEAERGAQQALGWEAAAEFRGGEIRLALFDADGRAVRPRTIWAALGRPTHAGDDVEVAFAWNGEAYAAPAPGARGRWQLSLKAEAADGTLFRRRIPLFREAGQ